MSDRASEHLMRHYAGFIPCGGLREVTPSPAASSPAGDTRPAIRTEYAGRTSFIAVGRSYRDHSGDVWMDPICDDIGFWYLTSQRYGTRERFFADGRHWAAPGSSQDLVAVVEAPARTVARSDARPLLRSDVQREPYCDGFAVSPAEAVAAYARTQAEADVETALRASPDFALGFHPDDERTLTPREQREQVREEILILGVIGFISSLVLAAGALGLMAVFGWGF